MKKHLREIACGAAVVLAASLGITGAILLSNLNSERDGTVEVGPPLRMQIVEIPVFLKGEKVTSAALSGKGLLALGTAGGRVSILDGNLQASRGGWERSAGPSAISHLAFSSDGAALGAATEGELLVWSLDAQDVQKKGGLTIKDTSEIPIGAMVRSGSIWPWPPSAIALSSGGRWLAAAGFNISLFWVPGEEFVGKFEQEVVEGGIDPYYAVTFTPDSKTLVASSGGGVVDAWSLETGKRRSLSCFGEAAFSRDAALVSCGTDDAHVPQWDAVSAELLKDKTVSVEPGDDATAVSRIGTHVLVGSAGGWIVVWDSTSDAILGRAQPSGQPIVRAESSDDGRLFLVEGQKAESTNYQLDRDRWLVKLTRS